MHISALATATLLSLALASGARADSAEDQMNRELGHQVAPRSYDFQVMNFINSNHFNYTKTDGDSPAIDVVIPRSPKNYLVQGEMHVTFTFDKDKRLVSYNVKDVPAAAAQPTPPVPSDKTADAAKSYDAKPSDAKPADAAASAPAEENKPVAQNDAPPVATPVDPSTPVATMGDSGVTPPGRFALGPVPPAPAPEENATPADPSPAPMPAGADGQAH